MSATGTMRKNTLQRLRLLETLYQNGYQDEVVDRTVEKLFTQQIQKDESQLRQLQSELVEYEKQFGLTSDQFEAKYQRGEMGDDADIFEWHTLYKMVQRLQTNLQLLNQPQISA